jgi:hypothetical protein
MNSFLLVAALACEAPADCATVAVPTPCMVVNLPCAPTPPLAPIPPSPQFCWSYPIPPLGPLGPVPPCPRFSWSYPIPPVGPIPPAPCVVVRPCYAQPRGW